MTGRNLTTVKQAALSLIGASLDGFAEPMQIAKGCLLDQIGNVRPNDRRLRADQLLANARHNHRWMLPHAAKVRATVAALRPIISPHAIPISREIAIRMLVVLRPLIRKDDAKAVLESCAAMFAPGVDIIGTATGLWKPISRHPVIVALALLKLKNEKVFASQAELRAAMQESEASIKSLVSSADEWMKLLADSDRIVFAHDRAGWNAAYANARSETISAMLVYVEMDEDASEDDDDEAISPRWNALNELRQAKQIEPGRK